MPDERIPMRTRIPAGALIATMLVMIVGGCTPATIRDLTRKTSDHAIDLSVHLERFAKQNAASAQTRINLLAEQRTSIAISRHKLDRQMETAKLAGIAKPADLHEKLTGIADGIAKKQSNALATFKTAKTTAEGSQVKLETEAEIYRTLGTKLLELSKEDDGGTRLKFMLGFAKTVADAVKKAQDDAQAVEK